MENQDGFRGKLFMPRCLIHPFAGSENQLLDWSGRMADQHQSDLYS